MEPTKRPQSLRRKKFVKPRLQTKLVLSFIGISAMTLCAQLILLAHMFSELANRMPKGGAELLVAMPGFLMLVSVLSLGVLLPLTFGFGILITHRIAGPVYRFERHLATAAKAEDPGVCAIRAKDELQELCESINAGLAGAYQRGLADAADKTLGKAA